MKDLRRKKMSSRELGRRPGRRGGELSSRACAGTGRAGTRRDKVEGTHEDHGGGTRKWRDQQKGEDRSERSNWT